MCVYDWVCGGEMDGEVRVEANAVNVEERYLCSAGVGG
jgi:hypothetical protein